MTLIVLHTVLATITPIPITIPVNPGPNVVIPPRQTAAQIESIRLDHTNSTKLFVKYNNTYKTLKQHLVRAVNPMYLKAIRNKYLEFGVQTCLTILAHLYANYATITASELLLNDKQMKAYYSVNLPIETLLE